MKWYVLYRRLSSRKQFGLKGEQGRPDRRSVPVSALVGHSAGDLVLGVQNPVCSGPLLAALTLVDEFFLAPPAVVRQLD